MSELATIEAPPPSLEVASPPPLRDEILAGRFFGHRYPAAAERAAGSPYLPAAPALAEWFGAATALRLGTDADGCRAALDRDIAAIDALIGEQLDAVLHTPRLRRFEGRWRGLACATACRSRWTNCWTVCR